MLAFYHRTIEVFYAKTSVITPFLLLSREIRLSLKNGGRDRREERRELEDLNSNVKLRSVVASSR